jgi:PilZ domain-containing protein
VICGRGSPANYSGCMTLSSLVVSRDWPEVSVLECILGGLHIGVDVEPEPARARAKLARSKIDALIVDCDLDGTQTFLHGLSEQLNTVPLVIIGGPNSRQLKDTDATFVFEKPISVEQAVRTLSAARNLILDGRLRYHRHSLDIPAAVIPGKGRRLKANLLNLSQGGVAVRLRRAAHLTGKVGLEFKLPGSNAGFKVTGNVIWNKQDSAGIHFVEMSHRLQRDLHLWLAQQYLRH